MSKDILMALSVMGIPALAFGFILSLVLSYRLKNKMIEKGYVQAENQAVFNKGMDWNHLSPLKWGLVIFFGGLALVLLEYIPYRYDSPFPFGLVAMFVSFGFLIYFLVARREKEKLDNK